MATLFGLTSTGFVAMQYTDILLVITQGMQAAFGASFDVSDGSAAGQLAAIMAALFAELWELAQQVANSTDPDSATGTSLDAIGALTGTIRLGALASAVYLTLCGTPTTDIAAGYQATTASTGAVTFQTLADAIIALVQTWGTLTPYNLKDLVTANGNVYYCIGAGTSASSGPGPGSTSSSITDGTVTWRYVGQGTGSVTTLSQATETGPLVAVSGDVTVPVTPVGGVNTVINILDATLGRDVEADSDFRVRRQSELASNGASTQANLEALLLEVTGVTAATVFVNNTDLPLSSGLTAHSIEALVQGGADQDIVNLLGSEVAAGIATYGTSSGTYTDTEGTVSTIRFTRPVVENVYVQVTLLYSSLAAYAGDAAVKAAIAALNGVFKTGQGVVATRIASIVFSVAGVDDVPRSGSEGGVLISLAPSPTVDTTIVITDHELASFDTSRITVVSSQG